MLLSATQRYARLYEAACRDKAPQRFWTDLQTDMQNNTVSPRDFRLKELFENFVVDSHGDRCGREMIEGWGFAATKPGFRSGDNLHELVEAGAVTTSAFANITGQIVYNEVLDAWNSQEFIADNLARNVTTSFLDGERIAGISVVANENEQVGEAQPYPLAGLSEQYVDTPAPEKRGSILPITREAIIADRTGVLLERARSITNSLRISKERRVLATVLGIDTTWSRNGSSLTGTYLDSGAAPHDFDNLQATNELVDYTDVETALQLFDSMTDPDTGEPIVVSGVTMIVPTVKRFTAQRMLAATEIMDQTAAATSNDPPLIARTGPNPLRGTGIQMFSNAFVQSVFTASTSWWIGDFMKAFRYMEVWPISTVQAPSNSAMEFTHDIVQQFKVSEYGVPAVVEPRYVIQSNN